MKAGIVGGLIAVGIAVTAGSVALSGSVTRPPLAFQGNNWAIVQWVDWKDVDPMCRELGVVTQPGQQIQACTKGRLIIRPNPCPLSGYSANLDCHELGHINGHTHG